MNFPNGIVRSILLAVTPLVLGSCATTVAPLNSEAAGLSEREFLVAMHKKFGLNSGAKIRIAEFETEQFTLLETEWAVTSLALQKSSASNSREIINYDVIIASLINYCGGNGGKSRADKNFFACEQNGSIRFAVHLRDQTHRFGYTDARTPITWEMLVTSMFIPKGFVRFNDVWQSIESSYAKVKLTTERTWPGTFGDNRPSKIIGEYWRPATERIKAQKRGEDRALQARNDARFARQKEVRATGTSVCGLVFAEMAPGAPVKTPYMLFGNTERYGEGNKIQIRVERVMYAAGSSISSDANIRGVPKHDIALQARQSLVKFGTLDRDLVSPRISGHFPGDLTWKEASQFDSKCPPAVDGSYQWESPYFE